ncbi:MAG: hypothetical protein K9K88_05610 [Desulfobacterales bacterium]|nr:hypothetical protein [Desulfobacterales bacterium]
MAYKIDFTAAPDKFGNAVIDAWLASEGRTATSFHPVERLCYIESRGMGALEYELEEGRTDYGSPTHGSLVECLSKKRD